MTGEEKDLEKQEDLDVDEGQEVPVPSPAPLRVQPEDSHGVNSGALAETLWIDMVELGTGCAGDCLSCGAFESVNPEDRRVKPITIEQFVENITREISGVQNGARMQVHQLFRKYVTSGVDMEPLGAGIFVEAAEKLNEITKGRSRYVAISHGLNSYEKEVDGQSKYVTPPAQIQKLEELTGLIEEDKVPLFVLSMDAARMKGLPSESALKCQVEIEEMESPKSGFMKILNARAIDDQKAAGIPQFGENRDHWEARKIRVKRSLIEEIAKKAASGAELNQEEKVVIKYTEARNKRRDAVVEVNARGYARTLYTLMPAIRKGKRVTISLQGDDNKESLAYHGLARRILQRTADLLRDEHGISDVEINGLFRSVSVQLPRVYVGVGRAKNMLGVKPGGHCTVIPDPDFIENFMDEEPYRVTRGRLRGDGTLEIQANRPDRTYNDTVDPRDNPWTVVNLVKKELKGSAFVPSVSISLDSTSLGRRVKKQEVSG